MPDAPVRIAFCITELDPGGAERALVRIVTGLNRQQWQPHVYCLAERGPLAAELEAAEVPLTCLGMRGRRDLSAVFRLSREFAEFDPRLLQTFMFHGNLLGRFAARLAKVPIVVAGVRVVEPDARWRMRLDRWTSRYVNHTVCVSRGVAEQYRSMGYRNDQLTIVPNGVDFERFATDRPSDLTCYGIPIDARTVISVGRLHAQKGQRDLIAAFAQTVGEKTSHHDVHLLLVGDGPERKSLEIQAQRHGLERRIHFAGWQPEIGPLLRAADLFVLSSAWEGMPNVLLEAMAAGLPCVATNVEGVGELIMDGVTGMLVERHNRQALADAIQRLLNDANLQERLAIAGQQAIRTQFTWENTICGFESVWKNLLTQTPLP